MTKWWVIGALAIGCGGGGGDEDAGPVTGCATEGGPMCSDGLMCCTGVPYPEEGICEMRCDLDSDRALKERFEPVDEDAILARVSELRIEQWSYRSDPATRHIGPMSQDFHEAFSVGADERHIHTLDANGVALASIQALARRVEALERENEELRAEVHALRSR